WRLDAVTMPEANEALRLVERDPVLHPVAEMSRHDFGVLREPSRRGGIEPPAAAIQLVRIVPVKERDVRGDAGGEEAVDQLVIEFQTALVHLPSPRGQNARPGEAQSVRLEPQLLHDPDVVAPAVVMVAGDVAGVAGEDGALLAAEHVPHALPAPSLACGAFNLVRRRRSTPHKIARKYHDQVLEGRQ